MKRAQRRLVALEQARKLKIHISQVWPQFRVSGAKEPFKRISALVAAVKAKEDGALERLMAYKSRGHGRELHYGRHV